MKPFQEGYRCYMFNDKDISSCPYESDTDEFDAWMSGFFTAEEDEAYYKWRDEYGNR